MDRAVDRIRQTVRPPPDFSRYGTDRAADSTGYGSDTVRYGWITFRYRISADMIQTAPRYSYGTDRVRMVRIRRTYAVRISVRARRRRAQQYSSVYTVDSYGSRYGTPVGMVRIDRSTRWISVYTTRQRRTTQSVRIYGQFSRIPRYAYAGSG